MNTQQLDQLSINTIRTHRMREGDDEIPVEGSNLNNLFGEHLAARW